MTHIQEEEVSDKPVPRHYSYIDFVKGSLARQKAKRASNQQESDVPTVQDYSLLTDSPYRNQFKCSL